MTPKEKAAELVDKFTEKMPYSVGFMTRRSTAYKCALLCVDETLKMRPHFHTQKDQKEFNDFWNEVKKEIESL